MSNIGSNDIIGQSFKPIITNASYSSLLNLQKITVNNALIFSIPNKNGADLKNEGSIWLSDNEGYLYCISKPIKSYADIISSILLSDTNIKDITELKEKINDIGELNNKIIDLNYKITALQNRLDEIETTS